MNGENKKEVPLYVTEVIQQIRVFAQNNECSVLEKMKEVGRGEGSILFLLSCHDGPMKPSELALLQGTTKGRISMVLKSLELKGQVERAVDPENRRNILVSITETGRSRISEDVGSLRRLLESVFLEMGEKDSREYIRLLEKVLKLMSREMKGNR